MRSSFVKFAAAIAVAVLLIGCGGSDEPSDSAESDDPATSESPTNVAGSPSGSADPADASSDDPSDEPSDQGETSEDGVSVVREAFCDALDPSTVAETLGLDEAEVLADIEPGDEVQTDPNSQAVIAHEWTCTIGQMGGSSIAATWTIRDARAGSNDAKAHLKTLRGTLGAQNCEEVDDDSLGEDTQAVNCSRAATGSGPTAIGFTMAARAVVIDGTQLECYLASTDPEDLTDLTEAAPAVCSLFLDVVVG